MGFDVSLHKEELNGGAHVLNILLFPVHSTLEFNSMQDMPIVVSVNVSKISRLS